MKTSTILLAISFVLAACSQEPAAAEGAVVAHSNKAYLNFVGEEFTARHADGRLANVEFLIAENNELSLNEGGFDAIMLALSFHDMYFDDPSIGVFNPEVRGKTDRFVMRFRKAD